MLAAPVCGVVGAGFTGGVTTGVVGGVLIDGLLPPELPPELPPPEGRDGRLEPPPELPPPDEPPPLEPPLELFFVQFAVTATARSGIVNVVVSCVAFANATSSPSPVQRANVYPSRAPELTVTKAPFSYLPAPLSVA